tara:strand:- start:2205 stop:2726 length:522 start_codon:yes stop_codon:yes gene_type:complete
MRQNQINIEEAMKVLGVVPAMEWEAIRAAYRQKVLLTHPDIALGEDQETLMIEVNLAFKLLSEVTEHGQKPIPSKELKRGEDRSFSFSLEHIDALQKIVEVSHEIGDVIYLSEEEGLIQVLINAGTEAQSMLLIAIDFSVEPTQALFTMETDDAAHAPSLKNIIEKFSTLRAV